VYFAKLQDIVHGGTKNGKTAQYIVFDLDVVNLHTDCKNSGFASRSTPSYTLKINANNVITRAKLFV
jgi:hypothetical protein